MLLKRRWFVRAAFVRAAFVCAAFVRAAFVRAAFVCSVRACSIRVCTRMQHVCSAHARVADFQSFEETSRERKIRTSQEQAFEPTASRKENAKFDHTIIPF